jgi:hypothetical protein
VFCALLGSCATDLFTVFFRGRRHVSLSSFHVAFGCEFYGVKVGQAFEIFEV